ncbi:MAG: carbon storage regulator [Planctomycetes bacterium]|nr:carbon storage regulator [Planctomycetota bacterium]
MLVLSRKRDEEIVIGGDIRITVVEVSGNRVKLGISAPAEVPVHRAELGERLKWNQLCGTAGTSDGAPLGAIDSV